MGECLLVAISALLIGIIEGVLSKRKYKAKYIWLYPFASVVVFIGLYLRFGITFDFFWGIAFTIIALFFSAKDIIDRHISDIMHFLIFVLGCIRLSSDTWKSMVVGFFVCGLPMLLIALCSHGGMGGADIKCMATIGWAFGLEKGISILIISCLTFILSVYIISAIKREKIKSAPMVPYICASAILVYGLL